MGPQMEGRFLEANYPCSPSTSRRITQLEQAYFTWRLDTRRTAVQVMGVRGLPASGIGSRFSSSWRTLEIVVMAYFCWVHLVPNDLNHTPHLNLVENYKASHGFVMVCPSSSPIKHCHCVVVFLVEKEGKLP